MSRKHLTHSAGACVFCVTHPPQERMSRRDRSQNGFIAVSLRDTLAKLRQAEENPQRLQSEWLHRGVTAGHFGGTQAGGGKSAKIAVRMASSRCHSGKAPAGSGNPGHLAEAPAGSGNPAGGWRNWSGVGYVAETGRVLRNLFLILLILRYYGDWADLRAIQGVQWSDY